jgi:small subunit ribosomal protein S16
MIRIRLQRHGSKKAPFYRLVATDQRHKRDGRFKELLGTYNPMVEPNIIDFKMDRVEAWLGCGAQLSESAAEVLRCAREGKGQTIAEFTDASRNRREEARARAAQARTVDQVISQSGGALSAPASE